MAGDFTHIPKIIWEATLFLNGTFLNINISETVYVIVNITFKMWLICFEKDV